MNPNNQRDGGNHKNDETTTVFGRREGTTATSTASDAMSLTTLNQLLLNATANQHHHQMLARRPAVGANPSHVGGQVPAPTATPRALEDILTEALLILEDGTLDGDDLDDNDMVWSLPSNLDGQ